MTFQTSVATALPRVAPLQCLDTTAAMVMVAQSLQPDLAQGFQIDALRLRREMERVFGGSDADGVWDWKLAYEAGEVALVLFLWKFGRARPAACPACIHLRQDFDASVSKIVTVSPRAAAAETGARQRLFLPDPPLRVITNTTRTQ